MRTQKTKRRKNDTVYILFQQNKRKLKKSTRSYVGERCTHDNQHGVTDLQPLTIIGDLVSLQCQDRPTCCVSQINVMMPAMVAAIITIIVYSEVVIYPSLR